jgi:hypothetical protein
MSLEPLKPAALYRRADAAALGFETTAELADPAAPLGQARALAALAFGTGIKSPGYNLFALGPSAVGKHTIIRRHLEQVAAAEAVPPDWCYVHNFREPHKPRALKLPPGQGHGLRRDMEQLVDETVSGIQALFEGENYRSRREAIDDEFRERQSNALEAFGERARGKGIALIRTPVGLALAPMKNGEVVPPEVFRKLPREEQEKTGRDIEELQSELRTLMQQMPRVEKERRERIRELDREITMFAVGHSIDDRPPSSGPGGMLVQSWPLR